MAAIVCETSSASVFGDQTGSAHGGFLRRAMKPSAKGRAGSHVASSVGEVQIASGGGPLSSALPACRCMSITGSGVCGDWVIKVMVTRMAAAEIRIMRGKYRRAGGLELGDWHR